MQEIAPVYELHVKPTYSVVVQQRPRNGRPKSLLQIKNEVNLKENKAQGVISAKASKRLINAVNWLIVSAKDKTIFDKQTGKRFNFKVNFVTLTLPTLDHGISDHRFKSVLLHSFINTCRYKFGMQNFVWKVESQANGNIHAHFTTDVYMHWKELRIIWNRILEKNGIIEIYRRKHSEMSFENYVKYYNRDGKRTVEQMRRAFDHGVSSNWSEPNTTDVHAVHKVKDVGAYLAKYMGKSDKERRPITGRLWSCSYNLSEKNKLVIEMSHPSDFEILEPLHGDQVRYKQITAVSALSRKVFAVGEIFFYRLRDWGNILNGKLLEAFNNHRWNIRTGADVQALKESLVSEVRKVKFFLVDVFFDPDPTLPAQLECPF